MSQDKLTNDEISKNLEYLRQDAGGMVTAHNGVADRLLQNDKLYRSMKGDWRRTDWNGSKNIKITTGRQDGKFFITREQFNTLGAKLVPKPIEKQLNRAFLIP